MAIPNLLVFAQGFNDFRLDLSSVDFTLTGVADLHRNRRPIWTGMGGRFQSESVADLLRNTHRNWNKEKCPDPALFLKGIMRSIANHEIEHFFNFPTATLDPEDEKHVVLKGRSSNKAKEPFYEPSAISPEDNVIEKEKEIELIQRVRKLKTLAEGDEEMEMVMICFEDGFGKPSEIAANTGYDVTTVYNVIKRLKRRVRNIRF